MLVTNICGMRTYKMTNHAVYHIESYTVMKAKRAKKNKDILEKESNQLKVMAKIKTYIYNIYSSGIKGNM